MKPLDDVSIVSEARRPRLNGLTGALRLNADELVVSSGRMATESTPIPKQIWSYCVKRSITEIRNLPLKLELSFPVESAVVYHAETRKVIT